MSWVGKVDNTASVSVGWPLSKIQNPPRYKHKQIIIMKYLEEALTLTVLTAMCMYGYIILIVAV